MEIKCPRCGSKNIVKYGFKYTAHGKVQRYYCKDCYYIFTEEQLK